jgi:phosphoribosylformylglycinamidine synthase
MEDSIKAMADEIAKSQIIAIPGGFSGGDEPEGSAKLITAVFRNARISEAITDLLENRDGLMLGICNGFQALIKLGLVPYGKITPMKPGAPTLTYNTIGRHISTLVRTKVVSTKSPWLAAAAPGDIFTTPISHGEGRFMATDEEIAQLFANGQVALTYEGENPNGSKAAIEGITSPDGRILGKMGHIERTGKNLYKNVPGNYDTGIIESGVRYFK